MTPALAVELRFNRLTSGDYVRACEEHTPHLVRVLAERPLTLGSLVPTVTVTCTNSGACPYAERVRERINADQVLLDAAPVPTPIVPFAEPGMLAALLDMLVADEQNLNPFLMLDLLEGSDISSEARLRYYSAWCAAVIRRTPEEADALVARGRRIFGDVRTATIRDRLDQLQAQEEEEEAVELTEQELADLRAQAARLLNHADPLTALGEEFRHLGWGGDLQPLKLVYLAVTSRLLALRPGEMAAHTQINGSPSSGKNFALGRVLATLPPEAFVKYDAGTPRVMIYDAATYRHRVLVYAEADSLPGAGDDHGQGDPEQSSAASAIRTLLQDGRVSYHVVERVGGEQTVREIEKEGPTVLITTTVNRIAGRQLNSRLFALDMPEGTEQMRQALQARAESHLANADPEAGPEFLAFQRYLQALAPITVVVPFVQPLYTLLLRARRSDSRLLRDSARLLSLIEAAAVLNLERRDRDPAGRIIAELDDYATVAGLVGEVYATSGGVSEKVRELVAAVHAVLAADENLTGVSQTQVARHLNVSQQAISARVPAALRNGWLINTETRPRYPYRLAVGDPLPERNGLPSAETLDRALTRQPVWEE